MTDVTAEDSGNYTCIVRGHNLKSTNPNPKPLTLTRTLTPPILHPKPSTDPIPGTLNRNTATDVSCSRMSLISRVLNANSGRYADTLIS